MDDLNSVCFNKIHSHNENSLNVMTNANPQGQLPRLSEGIVWTTNESLLICHETKKKPPSCHNMNSVRLTDEVKMKWQFWTSPVLDEIHSSHITKTVNC